MFCTYRLTIIVHLYTLNKLSEYFNKIYEQIVQTQQHNLVELNIQYSHFNRYIDNLPNSITKLTLNDKFNLPITHYPNNLQQITFVNQFNYNIDNLPDKITHITFGYFFNQKIGKFPSLLEYLFFGNSSFSQTLHNAIPI